MPRARSRPTGWDLGALPRPAARRRITAVVKALYKDQGAIEPSPLRDPLDELILTMLSQNTNDRLRDIAFATLKQRFPHWQDVVDAPQPAVAEAIKIGGLGNVKSGRIQKVLETIRDRRGDYDLTHLRRLSAPDAAKELGQFTGVGPKTIACVLVFGCGHDVFPVDTHILRISKRLGLIPDTHSLEKAHEFWAAACPEGMAHDLHLLVIRHGRTVCHARKPDCAVCCLRRNCAYYRAESSSSSRP